MVQVTTTDVAIEKHDKSSTFPVFFDSFTGIYLTTADEILRPPLKDQNSARR